MTDRIAKISRKTNETDISIEMNLDGQGRYEIDTGVGFFDHMLTHLSKHSGIDLKLKAKGDLDVDGHHTVEDVAICMGQAMLKALGDKKGIIRYGNSSVPMEDALANIAIDLSGRPFCAYDVNYTSSRIGDFDLECIEEFLRSLANNGKFNIHIAVPYGTNNHHIAEAIFKGLGQAMGRAVTIAGTDIPSTKGCL